MQPIVIISDIVMNEECLRHFERSVQAGLAWTFKYFTYQLPDGRDVYKITMEKVLRELIH